MSTAHTAWEAYVKEELPRVGVLLKRYAITLDTIQPHTQGERFLMQAVTTFGGIKLILLGRDEKTGKRVVIKVSNEQAGKNELQHERTCRTALHAMRFSYESFHSPLELLFLETEGYTIFVSEYIAQTSTFLERPLPEQFSYSLRALKAQEQTRATTAGHFRSIKAVFGTRTAQEYLQLFDSFYAIIQASLVDVSVLKAFAEAKALLQSSTERIEQYGGFLTHTDFVPHNFRISNDTLYLLDFSSLRFGNKHESWARFLNFMTLYNRELESLLLEYVQKNRAPEECESLHIMRVFRLCEIITYYAKTLEKTSGDLRLLSEARISFWTEVLKSTLVGTRIKETVVTQYKAIRDRLRSDDEKARQTGLH